MAILKFEVDTDDIWRDEDGYGKTFEQLFKSAFAKEVKKDIAESAAKGKFDEMVSHVKESVAQIIEEKLNNLINEDIAISDRWGEPKFVGSVEDYIKKQIDDKLLRPVNSDGKTVTGCSSSDDTWIEWRVKKSVDSAIRDIENRAIRDAKNHAERHIKKTIDDFKVNTLKSVIIEKLSAVGVIGHE